MRKSTFSFADGGRIPFWRKVWSYIINGKQYCNSFFFFNYLKAGYKWGIFIIPTTWEAEAGRSLGPRSSRSARVTARLPCQKKIIHDINRTNGQRCLL
jgi:hypothetical protein